MDVAEVAIDAFFGIYLQFDDIPAGQCQAMPNGARFVAGFGQFVVSSLKAYIEDNRGMLTGSDEEEVRAAVGN